MTMAAKSQTQAAPRPALRPATEGAPVDEAKVRELTQKLAYEMYEKRGRRAGRDREDWLEAERIVREQLKSGTR